MTLYLIGRKHKMILVQKNIAKSRLKSERTLQTVLMICHKNKNH